MNYAEVTSSVKEQLHFIFNGGAARSTSAMSKLPDQVTELLHSWNRGDGRALDDLIPLVYSELRRLARLHMLLLRSKGEVSPM